MFVLFFFFKQKTAYEMRISDWSSDVCSSDLTAPRRADRRLYFRFAADRPDVDFPRRLPSGEGSAVQEEFAAPPGLGFRTARRARGRSFRLCPRMSCAVPPDGTGRTHIKAGECRAVAILARSRRGRIAEQRGKKSVHGDGHHAAALSVAPALQPGMDDEGAYSRRSAARQICASLWRSEVHTSELQSLMRIS